MVDLLYCSYVINYFKAIGMKLESYQRETILAIFWSYFIGSILNRVEAKIYS